MPMVCVREDPGTRMTKGRECQLQVSPLKFSCPIDDVNQTEMNAKNNVRLRMWNRPRGHSNRMSALIYDLPARREVSLHCRDIGGDRRQNIHPLPKTPVRRGIAA